MNHNFSLHIGKVAGWKTTTSSSHQVHKIHKKNLNSTTRLKIFNNSPQSLVGGFAIEIWVQPLIRHVDEIGLKLTPVRDSPLKMHKMQESFSAIFVSANYLQ